MKLSSESILRMFTYLTISAFWVCYSFHFYSIMELYAELRYFLTKPILYGYVESWAISCLIVATYFLGKAIDALVENV